MFEEGVFEFIEKVAPILAEVLISPAAGMGTAFVLQLLHITFGVGEKDREKLGNKILTDPEAINKLKDLNDKFKPFQEMFCNKGD